MSVRRAIREVAATRLRAALLAVLAEARPQQMSLAMLREAVHVAFAGEHAAAEDVDAAVDWLARRSLAARTELAGGADYDIVALTRRGLDAAEGRVRLPGLAAPPPPGDA